MEAKALNNQSLLDLAVQIGGAVESVIGIMVENDLSITSSLESGDTLVSPDIIQNQIKDYYNVKGLTPATFSTIAESRRIGIGNMTIQQDFIVEAK